MPEPSHALLDELEAGIGGVEQRPGDEREQEGDDRRQQRGPADLRSAASSSPQEQDEGGADQRQDDEAGENAEAEHQRTPPSRYQVMKRRDADQHREGVVVDVAGLQLHDAAGDVDHARRNAVGPRPSMILPSPPFQNRWPSQKAGRTKMKS